MPKRYVSALLVSVVAIGVVLGGSVPAAHALIQLDAKVESSMGGEKNQERREGGLLQFLGGSSDGSESDRSPGVAPVQAPEPQADESKAVDATKNKDKEVKEDKADKADKAEKAQEVNVVENVETLGPNLIRNSSVETPKLLNRNIPVYWKRAASGSNARRFAYPVEGHDGEDAVKVEIRSHSSGNATWMFSDVRVNPGKTYEYSDHSMSNVATEVRARFRMSDGKFAYRTLGTVPANSAFAKSAFRFEAPAGAVSVTVQHMLAAVGTLTADSFSLNEVATQQTPPAAVEPKPEPPAVKPEPQQPPLVQPEPNTGGQGDANIFSTGAVSFRFDDNWASQYSIAAPKLESAGFKGTFYVTSRQTSDNGFTGFMSVSQIKSLSAKGHEIGGHTRTHPHLLEMSASERRQEIAGGRQDILSWGIPRVDSFAYPYGQYDGAIISEVRDAGFASGAATWDGENMKSTPRYELRSFPGESHVSLDSFKKAIDDAKSQKEWLVIELHRIDDSGDQYSVTPATFRAIVDYVKQIGIPVVTVSEGVRSLE